MQRPRSNSQLNNLCFIYLLVIQLGMGLHFSRNCNIKSNTDKKKIKKKAKNKKQKTKKKNIWPYDNAIKILHSTIRVLISS